MNIQPYNWVSCAICLPPNKLPGFLDTHYVRHWSVKQIQTAAITIPDFQDALSILENHQKHWLLLVVSEHLNSRICWDRTKYFNVVKMEHFTFKVALILDISTSVTRQKMFYIKSE